MKQFKFLQELALSLPETSEHPHFEKTSFKVKGKIFSTYDAAENKACFKFSASDQDLFSLIDKSVIYPIPNKWGKLGWTQFHLDCLGNDVVKDALLTAYCEVAPKKLAMQIKIEHGLDG
ncbi:MAG: MmcQ/YjbR family DNA-binding protein [Bacteroidia bacterium]|jgi:predicted DNA-binding protein (MmcQ/YjbR family)